MDIQTAINQHHGIIIGRHEDDAYRFLTVTFPDHLTRQRFVENISGLRRQGIDWERGQGHIVIVSLLKP